MPAFADLIIEGPEEAFSIPPFEHPIPCMALTFPNGVTLSLPKGMRPTTVVKYVKAYRP